MDLILWRHAEAEDADGEISDLDRCLTRRGEKQAKRVARWLLEYLPDTRRILVSPARRTRQTADALGAAYEIEQREMRDIPGVTAMSGCWSATSPAWARPPACCWAARLSFPCARAPSGGFRAASGRIAFYPSCAP